MSVGAAQLDAIGVVMDFHELERLLDAILAPLHNRNLNECEPFKTNETNPSAENLALYIGRALALPMGVRLLRVQVWETSSNLATYIP